jgi:hypothetical protein
MLSVLSLMVALQIGVTNTMPPTTQWRWVAVPEGNTPVAVCDANFACHCPVGYKADIRQSAASTEAMEVTCVPMTGASQMRETYDNYPVLPAHENLGR